jgi:hypothetical protein
MSLAAIGGIVAGAGSILSGILSYFSGSETAAATKAADAKNYELMQQYRGDILGQNAVQNKFSQENIDISRGGLAVSQGGLDLSKEKFAFDKALSRKNLEKEDVAAIAGALDRVAQREQGFKNWLINLKKV